MVGGRAADCARRHWQHLAGSRTTRALTDLADTAVSAATCFILAEATRSGRLTPNGESEPQVGSGSVVLAMGKMGAFGFDCSSDIVFIVLGDLAARAALVNLQHSTYA